MVEWDGIWPGWSIGQPTVIKKMQLMQQLSWIIPRPTKAKNKIWKHFSASYYSIIFIAYFLAFTPKTQKSPKITQKLPRISKKCQNFPKFVKIVKIAQKNVKVIKITKKNVKNCWNVQYCQMPSKLSNVVNKLQNCQKFLSAFSKLANYFGKSILSIFFWVNFQN